MPRRPAVALAAALAFGASPVAPRAEHPGAPDAGVPDAVPVPIELDVTRTDAGFEVAFDAGPEAEGGADAAVVPARTLRPPELLADSPATYPEALRPERVGGEVALELLVDEEGRVSDVKVAAGVHSLLDQEAARAARGLVFKPASVGDRRVPVRLVFTYRFVPPDEAPRVAAVSGPAGVVEGQVRAKGSRKPLPGALVLDSSLAAQTEADGEGRFRLGLPAGLRWVIVRAPGFKDGLFQEIVVARVGRTVIYSLEPQRVNPYETIVRGERERVEVSRVTLHEQEIREVPGTMGDPFRVVMLLPGVGTMLSGVAYPVVRGSHPAATGYFLDGIRVPLLFHMALGPAVLHPDFIDSIDFYPGAAPPQFGRLMGGVVEGRLSQPRDKGFHATAYADFINAGGFVEVPFETTGTSVTLAARVSYTPWLIAAGANLAGAAGQNEKLVLDFWDYQGRVEQRLGPGRLRLLAFGSSDVVGTEAVNERGSSVTESVIFHRVDGRYRWPLGGGEGEVGLTWGTDRIGMESRQEAQKLEEMFWIDERRWTLRGTWTRRLDEDLKLVAGFDIDHRRSALSLTGSFGGDVTGGEINPSGSVTYDLPVAVGTFTGGWGQLVWEPEKRWTVVPGVRVDNYHMVPGVDVGAVEPRLTLRRALGDEVTLKAAAGMFHQPPITLVQVPVMDVAGLRMGLQEGAQFDVGAEWKIARGVELTVDLFFNRLFRTIELDPATTATLDQPSPEPSAPKEPGPAPGRGEAPAPEPERSSPGIPDLAARGRAYGVEVLLRHPLGGNWFGWLSLTLQRSERFLKFFRYDDRGRVVGTAQGWLPFMFDQTLIVNAVLSYKFASNWTVGGVLHFNIGRPEYGFGDTMREGTDEMGNPAWVPVDRDRGDRLPPFFRLDVRVAKSWAFERFTLDAYLDVLNVTVSQEVVAYDYGFEAPFAPGSGSGVPTVLKKTAVGVPVIVPILGVKGTY